MSILLRFGIGEAFVRFWFDDADAQRRARLARTTTAFVLVTSTAAGWSRSCSPGRSARLLLGIHDATLVAVGVLGLWAFTNLEIAYALLRVEERRRTYLIASVSNVLLTVALTVTLVVGFDGGARGYVLGQLRRVDGRAVRLWIFALRGHVAIRRGCASAARLARRCCVRLADRPGRRGGVRAERHRPRLHAARRQPGRGGPVRRGGQARDRRDRRGARLPARLAAAGLLARPTRPRPAASTRS